MRIGYRSPLLLSDQQVVDDLEVKAVQLLGVDWQAHLQTENQIKDFAESQLSDQFLLVRNIGSPQPVAGIDFLLIGQTGIWAIFLFRERGAYRIESARWQRYVPHMQEYVDEEENWVRLVRKRCAQLMEFLQSRNCPPWVHPLLLLTHPDSDVELREAAITAIPYTHLPAFLHQEIENRPTVLNNTEIRQVVQTLGVRIPPLPAPAEPATEQISPSVLGDVLPAAPAPASAPKKRRPSPSPKKPDNFFTSQPAWVRWGCLGVLILLNLTWIIGLAIAILRTLG